jgi:hypothetical protein
LRIIRSLSGKRLDPDAVRSLEAIYSRGEIQVPAQTAMPGMPEVALAATASTSISRTNAVGIEAEHT